MADCCDASSESMAFPKASENDVGSVPDEADEAAVVAVPDAVADGAACAAPALTAEPTLGMAGMAGITSGLDAQDGLVGVGSV